jgi:hypothetical protein
MDPIMVAVLLSWVEIKSVCEMLVKHPDNDDEKSVAEHILGVMDTHMRDAKPGSRAPFRAIRESKR